MLLYSDAAHRHLHSFPTRRSSDLGTAGPFEQGIHLLLLCRSGDDESISVAVQALEKLTHARKRFQGRQILVRSEEHTSELQSRRDLVCRLLLEKKKI